jgi:arylsulfatase A-like enzyme
MKLLHRILAAALALAACSLRADDRPTNVILIFADDLGYADLGCYGAKGYETPHLDKLAASGVRFTDFYVSSAVCSASRAALLTGCYHERVSIRGALGPGAKSGLNPEETTLPEMLKPSGYATGMAGKWHLGDRREWLPTAQGFDEYLGLPYSNDMWPHHPETPNAYPKLPLIQGDSAIDDDVTPEDQRQLTTRYTERAVAFIRRNKDRPFFFYLAPSMPHVPLFVSDKFAGKTKRGLFGDVIQEIDWSVGEVLRAVDECGLKEKTLVIFTSDNGPWLSYGDHAGSAEPLREGKGTSFEGGVRVPMIAAWPGKIPAGRTCAEPAMTIDILPTVAALTGAKLPNVPLDGGDISPLLLGKEGSISPHEALFFHYAGGELQAMRSGKWKLHFPHTSRTLGGQPGGKGGLPAKYRPLKVELELYDLASDIGETRNVAAANPEVVERLTKLAEEQRRKLGDSLQKRQGAEVRPPARAEPGKS